MERAARRTRHALRGEERSESPRRDHVHPASEVREEPVVKRKLDVVLGKGKGEPKRNTVVTKKG
jgi:hypothetical protein